MSVVLFIFSSRRRHTRSYGDWSSDVCSSDLFDGALRKTIASWRDDREATPLVSSHALAGDQIGRASCRERVLSCVVDVADNKEMYKTYTVLLVRLRSMSVELHEILMLLRPAD